MSKTETQSEALHSAWEMELLAADSSLGHRMDLRRDFCRKAARNLRRLDAENKALREWLDETPVAGQCRFAGAQWAECSTEHVRMVLQNPEEWQGYEVRYLYAAPQAAAKNGCERTESDANGCAEVQA